MACDIVFSGYGVSSVSKVVSPYHSVAAPAYGGYGSYGGYGVSKVVSPVSAYGMYVILSEYNQIIGP